jgi:hypothetical protein
MVGNIAGSRGTCHMAHDNIAGSRVKATSHTASQDQRNVPYSLARVSHMSHHLCGACQVPSPGSRSSVLSWRATRHIQAFEGRGIALSWAS